MTPLRSESSAVTWRLAKTLGALGIGIASFPCFGSMWANDNLEFESETRSVVTPAGQLPHPTPIKWGKLHTLCTGGGRVGDWLVRDGRLWLVGLRHCGEKIALADVYDTQAAEMAATWVTGQIITNRGKALCGNGYSGVIWEKSLILTVESGVITFVSERRNEDHPAVPKPKPGSTGTPSCQFRPR